MPAFHFFIIIGYLVSAAFSGSRVDVALELRGRAVQAEPPTAAVVSAAPRSSDRSAPLDSRPPIRVRAEAPGSVPLSLYPEVDHVLEVTDGLWAPPLVLRSADPLEELTLNATGTGLLRMELVNGTGHPLEAWPASVQVRFQLAESPLDVRRDRAFETDCPVETERLLDGEGKQRRALVCELPEGILDVRLEARGFIPSYLWELRMKPGHSLEPSTYELEEGASLIGTAIRENRAPAGRAKVVLEPTVSDNLARGTLARRGTVLEYRTATDERGFFQIRGIPQGTFSLQARLAEYGLGIAPVVQISAPVEHELGEPLTIPEFPAAVVTVSPATDSADEPWSLLLFDPDGVNRTARTDPLGEGRFELLPSGRYVLMVQDSDGQRWIAQPVNLSPREPRVDIRIEQVPVVGTLILDDEPLAADLYFGGRHGSESVEISSGADGEFFGLLPREGTWDVEIRADDPKVRTVEPNLLVEVDPGLGAAELAIELPGTTIEGRVIDEDGHPSPGAQVMLQSGVREAGITQVETGEDGSFSLSGQRPGTYHLKALGQGRTSSAGETVEVVEDRSTPPVELILTRPREIEGRVVSPNGRGVPGAIVWPIRETGSPFPLDRLVHQIRSGADGGFRLKLGSDSPYSALAILAPGFLLELASLPRETEHRPMEIVLEPPTHGGRLVFADVPGSRPIPHGMVTIDGRWILPLFLLTDRARQSRLRSSNKPLTVPDLPPGRYRVCTRTEASEPTCAAGLLSAGATLELHTHPKETRQ